MTKVQKFVEKLDITVKAKPTSSVGLIMFLLPVVSAKNPHKCELLIIPAKPMALIMPRSCTDRFKSHCDTGKTKLIPSVSSKTLASIRPHTNISI